MKDQVHLTFVNSSSPIFVQFHSKIIKELTEGKNLLRKRLAVSIRFNDQTKLLRKSSIEKGTESANKNVFEICVKNRKS